MSICEIDHLHFEEVMKFVRIQHFL